MNQIAIEAGKAAAAAAVRAGATNAAKPEVKTSELWVSILGGAAAAALGVLGLGIPPSWASGRAFTPRAEAA